VAAATAAADDELQTRTGQTECQRVVVVLLCHEVSEQRVCIHGHRVLYAVHSIEWYNLVV
jgi:hypothetical protein